MQKAYGDECLSCFTIHKWFKRFKEGREDLNDDERPGRPRSAVNEVNVENVREIRKRAEIFVSKGQTLSIWKCNSSSINVNAGFFDQKWHLDYQLFPLFT